MTEQAGSQDPVKQGSQGPTWRDQLTDDLKNHPTLANFQDINSLAKEHVNVQSLIGRKGIMPPKEGDAADLKRFHKELGAPEEWGGYEDPAVQIPEKLAPFFQVEKLNEMKKLSHELGLSKAQFKKLSETYLNDQLAELSMLTEQSAEELKAGDLALRKQWGMAYEQNKELSVKIAETYATSDAEKEFLSLHGNNPALISMLAKVGKDISEDTIAQVRANQGVRAMEPQAAIAEAERLMASEAFLNGNHPENTAVKKRVNDLFNMSRG